MLTALDSENEHGEKALRIAAMLGHFPVQEQSEAVMKVIVEDYMSVVDHIPAYAVNAGVKTLLLAGPKRRPSLKDFKDNCEVKAFRYLQLVDFLKRLREHWGE